MKIAINVCYGGFSLSPLACERLHCTPYAYSGHWRCRTAPELIALIEELGSKAVSGRSAELKVVEIPDDVQWIIEEYDGAEVVSEVHRIWC